MRAVARARGGAAPRRSMTGTWRHARGRTGGSGVRPRRRRRRWRALRRGAARRPSGSQIWKMSAQAHEDDGVGQAGVLHQESGSDDPALLVWFHRPGVGVKRVARSSWSSLNRSSRSNGGGQRVERCGGPALDAGDACATAAERAPAPPPSEPGAQRRAERRRDGHAALGVQPVLMRAQELAHRGLRPTRFDLRWPDAPGRTPPEPVRWDGMGYHGQIMGVKGSSWVYW